jgi:hypothetical protein
VQLSEAVLGEEAGAAAGLTGLLDGVEGRPGAERLEGCGQGLEILAIRVGVLLA